MALADQYDGFLIDLDGVVWIGREPVPGSAEALAALIEGGKPVVFVTNNPGRPASTYAERLRAAGVPADEAQIVTAGMVTAAPGGGAGRRGSPVLRDRRAGLQGHRGRGRPRAARRRGGPRRRARCSSPVTAASTTRSC